jgi:hypothetical protein
MTIHSYLTTIHLDFVYTRACTTTEWLVGKLLANKLLWATSSLEAKRLWHLSEKLVGQEFAY